MDKQTQEKIQQLQLIEQNLQNIVQQKQQFQSQLMDNDSALSEIEKSETAYKIIGTVMVLKDKETLKKELQSKREIVELRLKSIEKQEETLRSKAKNIQEEVLAAMKENENKGE